MLNEINAIAMKEDFLGNVYATGSVEQRAFWSNGVQKSVRAYAATSDKVANFTIYTNVSNGVGTVEVFEPLALKKPQLVAQSNTIGTGRDRNRFNEYYVLADGVSMRTDVTGKEATIHDSAGRMLGLKFKGGDVTKTIDVVETFGTFIFNGYEPVLKYDEELQALTDELIGYELICISSKTKKPYKVKCDNVDADFSGLRLRDVVEFENGTYRFYQDSSSTTQGSTISISVDNVRKAQTTTATKQAEMPKQKAETKT